jgi:hypothetical protein
LVNVINLVFLIIYTFFLEEMIYKTAHPSNSELVTDSKSTESKADSKRAFSSSSSSSAKQTNRWTLITRAHFTELLAYISLQTDIAPSVSFFLRFLFFRLCWTLLD